MLKIRVWAICLGLVLCGPVTAVQAVRDRLELDVSCDGCKQVGRKGANADVRRIVHFSRTALLSLPMHTIDTSTLWTTSARWEGPRLADVLARAGFKGRTLRVYSYDGSVQDIPIAFVHRYEPILAYRENGVELSLRNFGPLFLIFPRDQHLDVLASEVGSRRFVYQIKHIEVR